jgi:O-succinylbenzoate synthase
MKLAGVEAFRYELPLISPLVIKGRRLDVRIGLLVKLTSDSGFTGWGEVAPLPGVSRESLLSAQKQVVGLRSSLQTLDLACGSGPLENGFCVLQKAGDLTPAVRCGVELAVWNLLVESGAIQLCGRPSEKHRHSISINGLLTGAASEITPAAQRMADSGFKAVKLKVGSKGVDEDIEMTLRVREIIGEKISLRLDANRSWNLKEAVKFGKAVCQCGIEYIEEPVAVPRDIAAFANESKLPVALDETLIDLPPECLEKKMGVCAVILKPTLLGGFHRSVQYGLKALNLGLKPVMSSTYESGVGILGLAHLAAYMTDEDIPAGLDTYRSLAADTITPRIDTDGGQIDISPLARESRQVDRGMLRALSDG